jgi:hypothetical protein
MGQTPGNRDTNRGGRRISDKSLIIDRPVKIDNRGCVFPEIRPRREAKAPLAKGWGNNMTIPATSELHVCMKARMWGWQGTVPAEQLADLMDAIHNIPMLVQHLENCDLEWLKQSLEQYERKWAKSGGPCLRTIYENALSEGNRRQ